MTNVLSPIPNGFVASIEILEKLPKDVLDRMISSALGALLETPQAFPVEEALKVLCNAGLEHFTQAQLQSGYSALEFIFRTAAARRCAPEKLSEGLRSFVAEEDLLTSVTKSWAHAAPLLSEGKSSISSQLLPQVRDIQWRLGASVRPPCSQQPHPGGDAQPAAAPFVGLKFECLAPDATTSAEDVRVHLAEFKDFAKEIQALARAMDTM
mmetsp:Transcript_4031/g.8293  ORF Transcript_4031/g.8293 Transcript_4031/m.8293 type:complete len:210 (-) Transcript_4031:316-945(-)|eukprot:CAMPEP_0118930548 /NCGR_PEP_ID=MMETSP1169-20130426/7194_1 /TAXON_ID=36882 /ORGANISM="Pyramimonas obovata, Strain CCMP722" /LENGTH=209 /DNA_ID=CAMNT_0006872917 /DNA_START=126 /DNA_END=755 /DNA_ORIENTATION=-